jgi:hypothetical protein
MNFHSITILGVSLLTAAVSGRAAHLWYLSSIQEIPFPSEPAASISDYPEQHILSASVAICEMQAAFRECSQLNKRAAIWSAWAAGLGGLTALINTI